MISTSARQPRRWHSGLDGSIFEIDLSKKNAAALRKALTEFMEHGRRVKPNAAVKPGSRRSSGRSGASPAAIREWAVGQGISISPRGRVASDIVAQYQAANA
jgi:nucleoid-associated protein Lsr2